MARGLHYRNQYRFVGKLHRLLRFERLVSQLLLIFIARHALDIDVGFQSVSLSVCRVLLSVHCWCFVYHQFFHHF